MFKPGDKVIFDWNASINKTRGHNVTMLEFYKQYPKGTLKVFTVESITIHDTIILAGVKTSFDPARLKKATNKGTIEYARG